MNFFHVKSSTQTTEKNKSFYFSALLQQKKQVFGMDFA